MVAIMVVTMVATPSARLRPLDPLRPLGTLPLSCEAAGKYRKIGGSACGRSGAVNKGDGMKDVRSICVYCGSSSRVSDSFKAAAHELGTLLGQHDLQLVYGGGRVGLMGILADAALAAGARVVGIIPEHIQVLEVDHSGLTELHIVDSMHTRKRMMVDRADAFVVLPGGMGTLDETFEILTWKQLHLHDKPVIVADIDGYWKPLEAMIDHMIGQGFVQPAHRGLFTVVDRVADVLPALARQPEPAVRPETKWL
jgi:uncharacterized protein (TIGR00730 family)